MPETKELILIGKVSGTHGVRGQVRVVPFSGDAKSITSLRTFLLRAPDGECESREIDCAVEHKKRVLVKIHGVDDRDQAQSLVGREVYVCRDQLPLLPEDEYYWTDLLGLEVHTLQGVFLGRLVDILITGSNDVYVVKNEEREYLVPALSDVVLKIDLPSRKMVINPLEGMLDL